MLDRIANGLFFAGPWMVRLLETVIVTPAGKVKVSATLVVLVNP